MKVIYIRSCEECPHFYEGWSLEGAAGKAGMCGHEALWTERAREDRTIPDKHIPSWCPLDDYTPHNSDTLKEDL